LKISKIDIKLIPHLKQRYDTTGDYYEKDSVLHVRVSKAKDLDVWSDVLHELVEYFLVKMEEISIAEIEKFDKKYTGKREEPGDDPEAPYHAEHMFAKEVEKLFRDEVRRRGGLHKGLSYYVVLEKARIRGAKDTKPRKKRKLTRQEIERLREVERKAQMELPFKEKKV